MPQQVGEGAKGQHQPSGGPGPGGGRGRTQGGPPRRPRSAAGPSNGQRVVPPAAPVILLNMETSGIAHDFVRFCSLVLITALPDAN